MVSNATAKGETVSCSRSAGEGSGTSLGESMEACLLGNRGIFEGRGTGEVSSKHKEKKTESEAKHERKTTMDIYVDAYGTTNVRKNIME